jgi:3-(methylthio)propanoyl-CoA dehydrogenase
MKSFAAPLEDILFSLEHVAGASRLPGWDGDLIREILTHFAAFAENEIAPIDAPGDREGCRLEGGRVHTPEGFVAAYRSYAEQGWAGLGIAEDFGGQGMPAPVVAAMSEIVSGACHALQMACGLTPGAARTIVEFGTAAQRTTYIPMLASGEFLATMCLTEPGAGSDLSGIRTWAVEDAEGWKITGDKIFISGGDQDMSNGILHLVLARTDGMQAGIKGLSLFLCRSHDAENRRNTIAVNRIEEKMGLHGSPTCQVSFAEARAELLGEPGGGLRAMFTMMNHARLEVGLQGVAHAARACDIGKAYAAERRQGQLPGYDGQVTIAHHPDVARMVREMDALTLGMRAMCHLAMVTLEMDDNPDLMDFLTPVCKVFCTEAGLKTADMGIQILGGYGYLHEYRVEQNLRDLRIAAIYEGTNGIHSLALVTRALRLNGGRAATAFADYVQTVITDTQDSSGLAESLALWQGARRKVLAATQPAELAHPFMKLTGLVAYLAAWQRIASAAARSVTPERITRLAAEVRRMVPIEAGYWAAVTMSTP